MDFTPGVFDILIERGTGRPRRPEESRIRTTLAKQLALYLVLYSPLQMAADLPENYERQPAFQFIRDVAVDWDTTRVVDGRIGDYVVVARKARGSQEWFLGAITDEEARTFTVPLSFLPGGGGYVARDLPMVECALADEPLPVAISRRTVTSASTLRLVLAPCGGQAIRIGPRGRRVLSVLRVLRVQADGGDRSRPERSNYSDREAGIQVQSCDADFAIQRIRGSFLAPPALLAQTETRLCSVEGGINAPGAIRTISRIREIRVPTLNLGCFVRGPLTTVRFHSI